MKKRLLLRFFYIFIFFVFASSSIGSKNSYGSQDDKELFIVSQRAFEDGFYDVAIRYIDQLLKDFPQSQKLVEAKLLLGQCYFFKSQYLMAYETFQSLVDNPKMKDATLYWLGETYLKGSDFEEAKDHYLKIIQLFPQSIYVPQALYSLGWVYFEQNKFQEALNSFQDLLVRFPNHQFKEDAAFKIGECLFNLRDYQKAIDYFSNYLAQYPNSSRISEVNFFIAESYYYLEDPLSSIAYYAQVAEKSFDSKLTLMAKISLGWSYLRLKKYDLSQNNFEEASSFATLKGIKSDDVYYGLANLYLETKQYKKSLEAYDSLTKNFPDSKRYLESLLGKANIYYIQEKFNQAVRTYRSIIDKAPDDSPLNEITEKAYFGLAWSYLKAGNFFLAIKTFETIKEKSDSQIVKISAITQIADAYQDVGQLEKGLEVYDSILKNYPDSPYTDYVQYRQGITLLKMDKIESATLSFQSLEANFPESKYLIDVKYYLAVAHFKKQNWENSKEQIQSFLKKKTENNKFVPDAYYILALSQFHLNEYSDAIKNFRYIIKNFPEKNTIVRSSEINIAKSLYKNGKIKEALKKFNDILESYPKTDIAQESLIWLGDHYLGINDFKNTIFFYSQVVEQFPGSDKKDIVLYQLGQTYQIMGNYIKAIESYKKIDPKNDPDLSAKSQLAIASIFALELDIDQALETYNNIIKTSPEYQRNAYLEIAKTYKKQKEYLRSLETYQKALKADIGSSDISNAELQFHIADNYQLLNKPDKAIEEYFKIPYLYSDNLPWVIKSYLRIARIFEDDEKWEKAKMIYQKIADFKTDELKFVQERLEWIKENIKE